MVKFEIVQAPNKEDFETRVNTLLEEGYVFAGNILYSDSIGWSMPMVLIEEDAGMDTRLAKQLWGLFIARLF